MVKNQQAQKIAHAGDIVIVTKLQSTKTGDTLCDAQSPIRYESVEFADSMFTMAIKADKKTDEDKIGNALNRLIDEDPTLKLEKNTETGDLLISGVGEAHLDIALEKLLNKFGVTAKLYKPEIAYRETIRGTSKVEGKHKKQSGGHGQYGDVWLEFSPGEQQSSAAYIYRNYRRRCSTTSIYSSCRKRRARNITNWYFSWLSNGRYQSKFI